MPQKIALHTRGRTLYARADQSDSGNATWLHIVVDDVETVLFFEDLDDLHAFAEQVMDAADHLRDEHRDQVLNEHDLMLEESFLHIDEPDYEAMVEPQPYADLHYLPPHLDPTPEQDQP